ncbi:MAG: HIT domain-containing protein [Thermoleophilia bacterium]
MAECLFCRLVESGDHVHAEEGFVAIRDIAPAAETHLLVLPRRHIATFREIDAFPDEEVGQMLRFVAMVAAAEGLDDYRVIVNVGSGGGQTVFHLHWHILAGNLLPGFH